MFFVQTAAQLLDRETQPPADRGRRLAEQAADGLGAPVLEVAQHDDPPVGLGQLLDEPGQQVVHLHGGQRLFWRRRPRGFRRLGHLALAGAPPELGLAPVVDQVPQHRGQPAPDRSTRAGRASHRRERRVLDQVVRLAVVGHQPPRQPPGPAHLGEQSLGSVVRHVPETTRSHLPLVNATKRGSQRPGRTSTCMGSGSGPGGRNRKVGGSGAVAGTAADHGEGEQGEGAGRALLAVPLQPPAEQGRLRAARGDATPGDARAGRLPAPARAVGHRRRVRRRLRVGRGLQPRLPAGLRARPEPGARVRAATGCRRPTASTSTRPPRCGCTPRRSP